MKAIRLWLTWIKIKYGFYPSAKKKRDNYKIIKIRRRY